MLGGKEQSFFTVKDLAPAEFINAFATYLKKNNLIERPVWADYAKTSTGITIITQPANSLLLTKTGSTSELLPLPGRSTCAPELESDCSPIFTAEKNKATVSHPGTSTPAPRLSGGLSSSLKSKKSSRKIRNLTSSRSMLEWSPTKAEAPSTGLPPSTSRTKRTDWSLFGSYIYHPHLHQKCINLFKNTIYINFLSLLELAVIPAWITFY